MDIFMGGIVPNATPESNHNVSTALLSVSLDTGLLRKDGQVRDGFKSVPDVRGQSKITICAVTGEIRGDFTLTPTILPR